MSGFNQSNCLAMEKFLEDNDEKFSFEQISPYFDTWRDIRNDCYNAFLRFNCVRSLRFAWKYCRVEPEIIVDEHLPRYRLSWSNNEASFELAKEMYSASVTANAYNAISYLERSMIFSNCIELLLGLNISFDNSSFVSLAKYEFVDRLYATMSSASRVLNFAPAYYEAAKAYFRS